MPTSTRPRGHVQVATRGMSTAKNLLLILSSLTAIMLLSPTSLAQQGTLTDDTSYPKAGSTGGPAGGPTGGPTTQSELTLKVRGTGSATGASAAFIKFKLTGATPVGIGDLPSGTPGSHVAKATLKLFVSSVGTAGSFDVYRVTGAWTEGGAAAPAYDAASPVASGVQVSEAGSFVTLDITALVRQWLDFDPNNPAAGGYPNYGLALVASAAAPNTSVEFDSKEATQTSHQAQLGVVLSHAQTADQATNADHAAAADNAAAVTDGVYVTGSYADPPWIASLAGGKISGAVGEATHAVNADNATIANTANSLAASAAVPGSQVSGDIAGRASSITGTVAGGQVSGPVAEASHAANADNATNAVNATTADAARGVVSATTDADIASPAAGQLYFNTTLNVIRQYDGTVWKTVDAGLAAQLSGAGTLNAPDNPVDWTQLKNVPAGVANGTASDLACAGCVSEAELSFTPATAAQLTEHKNSDDHDLHNDGRYSMLGHGHDVSEVGGAATLGANSFNGDQSVNGRLTASNTLVGDTAGVGASIFGEGTDGIGVLGRATAPAGSTIGVHGQVQSPGGTAGVFVNSGGGMLLRGVSGDTQRFSVDGSGNVETTGDVAAGQLFLFTVSRPPLRVNSQLHVSNLNADLLDGFDSSAFAPATGSAAYAAATHTHDVSQVSNAATLGTNNFTGSQSIAGNVSATGTVSGAGGSFQNHITIGNSTGTGGGITLTDTFSRFVEVGSHVNFDSFGFAPGIRLRTYNVPQPNAWGLVLGDSDGHYGSFIIRQDDMSIPGGGYARNRLIINQTGDVIVNNGKLAVGTESPTAKLDVVGDARVSGNVTAASFAGDGSGLTNVSAGTPTDLNCTGCVSAPELGFDPATQAELDAHKSSADHDARYVPRTGGSMTGALSLPANGLNVGGSQLTLANGNVGIGTVNPTAPLVVEGSTLLRNLIATPQDAGLEGGEVSLQGAPGFHSWQVDNYAGNFRLHSQGSSRFEVAPGGNVGLGTAAPSQKLEVVGNVRVNGNFVATGLKSAVVTLPDNREVALYAVESPGNWFEDFGHAALSNGVAQVELDPTFAQTVNTEMTYHVFLTPNGNCNGLYVARKTTTGFEVRELGGGQTNVAFDYRIVARRRGYENVTSKTR